MYVVYGAVLVTSWTGQITDGARTQNSAHAYVLESKYTRMRKKLLFTHFTH